MSCSLGRNRHQAEAVSLGLQGQHAYTITKVASILKVEVIRIVVILFSGCEVTVQRFSCSTNIVTKLPT